MTDNQAKDFDLRVTTKMVMTILPQNPEVRRIYQWLKDRQGQPISVRDFPASAMYRFSQILYMLKGWVRWREKHYLVEGRGNEARHIERRFVFWGFE